MKEAKRSQQEAYYATIRKNSRRDEKEIVRKAISRVLGLEKTWNSAAEKQVPEVACLPPKVHQQFIQELTKEPR